MITTPRPIRALRSPVLKGALVALAAADLVPLVVLALTFFPGFMARPDTHGHARPLGLVRASCVAALAALALLWVLRHRLDALIQRLNAYVRGTVAASGEATAELATPALARILTTVGLGAALVSVGVAFTSTPAFRALIAEDGIVEYGSSLSWFAAAACAAAALFLDRRRFGLKVACYAPLIALCVLAGGEEISWGQRIFHFQTPTAVETMNRQRELNLHDIGSISVTENAFLVFTTVCCLVIPWLLSRAPEWRTYLRQLNAPIVDPFVARVYGIGLVAWIVVGLRFGTLGFSPFSLWGYYTQLDDEIWELFAAFAFFSLAALDLAHRLSESRPARVVSTRRAQVNQVTA